MTSPAAKPNSTFSDRKGFSLIGDKNQPTSKTALVVKEQMPSILTTSNTNSSASSSTKYLSEVQKSALFSANEMTERRRESENILKELVVRMNDLDKKVITSLEDYYKESRSMNQRLAKSAHHFLDLVEKLSAEGKLVEAHHAQILDYGVKCCGTIRDEFAATSKQLQIFQDDKAKADLARFGKFIEVAFEARFKELEFVSKQLKMMQEQSKFEQESDLKLREQEMKERSQNFDILMKLVQQMSEEEKQEFEMYLKEHEMDFKQQKDLYELATNEKKVLSEIEFQKQKLQVEKELSKEKMAKDHEIEKKRINAQLTTELTKKAITLVKPSLCNVM